MNTVDVYERWHVSHCDGKPDYLETIITLPIHTVSESNKREHWAAKSHRAKGQRTVAALGCSGPLASLRKTMPVTGLLTYVHLTRIAPRELDDDNLRGALKSVRDGVTDALGLPSDRDDRLRWQYSQDHGAPSYYGVRVTVWRSGALR